MSKTRPKTTWRRVDKFADGTATGTPLSEVAVQWLRSAAHMFCSSNPEWQLIGAQRLATAGQLLARVEEARLSTRAAQPPERQKNPLRAQIIGLMRTYREGSFKTFLAAWEMGPLSGIRLRALPTGYSVVDEEGDADERFYRLGSLTRMFSEAATPAAARTAAVVRRVRGSGKGL